LNRVAPYVIKDHKTYRTFVDDGKRWSMRETDGKIFPDYQSAEQKIDELRKLFPKRHFFSQEVGLKENAGDEYVFTVKVKDLANIHDPFDMSPWHGVESVDPE